MKIGVTAAIVSVITLTACGTSRPEDGPSRMVVVTTSILGDVTARVVGDVAQVEVLLGVGVDPHDFQLSSAQAALLRQATVVIANGLGLEEGIAPALASAAQDGVKVIELAPSLDPIPFGVGGRHEEGEPSGLDPHFWHDPIRMADAVRLIAEELADLGPKIAEQAEAYISELIELDAGLDAMYGSIPAERRIMITNHDSFGYLAERYDLKIVGVVIPGGSTLSEPSSADIADLVATIHLTGAPAIFTEKTSGSGLAEAIAGEAGRPVEIVTLYSDSLGGSASGAETYLEMMRYNARSITDALAP